MDLPQPDLSEFNIGKSVFSKWATEAIARSQSLRTPVDIPLNGHNSAHDTKTSFGSQYSEPRSGDSGNMLSLQRRPEYPYQSNSSINNRYGRHVAESHGRAAQRPIDTEKHSSGSNLASSRPAPKRPFNARDVQDSYDETQNNSRKVIEG